MEKILNDYYANNASKLHIMVDKILFKLRFVDVDNEDFYSLANEVFVDVIKRYDNKQDFDGFLYSCLTNKFKTEMTRRNREKRKADKMAISWDTPIGDDEGSTLIDVLASESTVEKEIFEENKDGYSKKMLMYLDKLSKIQKEILRLVIAGYEPNEIREELHMSNKEYADNYAAIHSYRNVQVLF